MGFTRAEFLQLLPAALRGYPYRCVVDEVRIQVGEYGLTITLGEERQRRIASLVLPLLPVTFAAPGMPVAEFQQFLAQFDLYYRKGGG